MAAALAAMWVEWRVATKADRKAAEWAVLLAGRWASLWVDGSAVRMAVALAEMMAVLWVM